MIIFTTYKHKVQQSVGKINKIQTSKISQCSKSSEKLLDFDAVKYHSYYGEKSVKNKNDGNRRK